MENGLASNAVNSLVQDTTGYLWIATNNGLQRFDGVRFRTFRHREGDLASLPENNVIRTLTDKQGQLWLMTASGHVGIFDRSRFRFQRAGLRSRIPRSVHVEKQLLTDEYGHLFYLVAGQELTTFDPKQNAFTPTANFLNLPPEWQVVSMVQQPGTRKYWIGSLKLGLVIFNRETNHYNYAGNNIDGEPAIGLMQGRKSLLVPFFDRKGRLWCINWDKGGAPLVLKLQCNSAIPTLQEYELFSQINNYHEVSGFMQQADGRVWLNGLQVFGYYNESADHFYLIPNDARHPEGIGFEAVSKLYEDREHNLWVSTSANGVFRYNPSTQYFTNFRHFRPGTKILGEGGMLSFVETRNGDLLAASWGEGLFRYDKQLNPIPLGIRYVSGHPLTPTWDIFASADSNTIWIAGQPGLFTYNQDKGTIDYRNPPPINRHTIRQLVEDRRGNLWLGMHAKGVYRWINPKQKNSDSIVKVPGPADAMINVVHLDRNGWIWIGTAASGLFVYNDKGQLLHHWRIRGSETDKGVSEGISGLADYNDSLMAVGAGGKLFWYNRKQHRLARCLLPDDLLGEVSALQPDKQGFLWISTTNALYRYHPARRTLVMFNRQDGIPNDQFTLSASYHTQDGRILLGTSNSFVAFRPGQVQLSANPVPVVFTGIQAGKRDLPVDSVLQLKVLDLGAENNSLTVSFSPLAYASNNLVQYKMEGINNEWQMSDRDNKASFPFLPPGTYQLLLRTINAEGLPSEVPTTLLLQVAPPFYQSWWFFTLLAVALAALLFLLDRQRMQRKQALEQVRTDIANGLHQEVNTALNNINILSEIARLKSDRDPQKTKEYLEQIHAKSHNMIIAMDDILWSLDPENDNMVRTISRVREFADALMQRHGVAIQLLIDKKVENLELDMKLRHEAFLLFKEGLRSLVAAGTPHCVVHLALDKTKLLFTIDFQTEGCNMQQLTNLLHRRDMDARIHNLRAKLQVQVHKGRSTFLLQLPLG